MSDWEAPAADTSAMTGAELIEHLGADTVRWADAFLERFEITARPGTNANPWPVRISNDPRGLMAGWFGHALRAGERNVADPERRR